MAIVKPPALKNKTEMIDTQIKNGFSEFLSLGNKNLFEVAIIQAWLIKYEPLYDRLIQLGKIKFNKDGYCDIKLLNPAQNDFFSFYRYMQAIVDESKYDSFCRDEMLKYQLIKDDRIKLKAWLKSNYNLGIKTLGEYFYHMDYQGPLTGPHLRILHFSFDEMELYVNRKDFKNMIAYILVVNDLFYEQKLYPEQLKAHELKLEYLFKMGYIRIPDELL